MRDEDWKTLMKALSIYVQGVHFSKGTTQREQEAIADHMIGVAEVIEGYRQPPYIEAMTDANIRLRKELEATLLQVGALEAALKEEMKISESRRVISENAQERAYNMDRLNGEMLALIRKIDSFFENPKIIPFKDTLVLDIPYEIAAGVKSILTTPQRPKRDPTQDCGCLNAVETKHRTDCPMFADKREVSQQKNDDFGLPMLEDLLGECRECNRLCRDCGNHGPLDR